MNSQNAALQPPPFLAGDTLRRRIVVLDHSGAWEEQLAVRLQDYPVAVIRACDWTALVRLAESLPYLKAAVLFSQAAGNPRELVELVARLRRTRPTLKIIVDLPWGERYVERALYVAGADRVFAAAVPPEISSFLVSTLELEHARDDNSTKRGVDAGQRFTAYGVPGPVVPPDGGNVR